ncbi:MAG: type IV toxin-antitoxin system AbiEi family antitoxin domain-containing protein [Pseudomonadales bacterium]|nr:type IV toxin-antitoxin system AbiEi family antitoxin domain-containing protein [Pseudomonadales bacterium]MCP5343509.1 type IV toxin-antitoxin system AbiEi family antitoxin domain-containing protein [Pseudomonadales bacterium]
MDQGTAIHRLNQLDLQGRYVFSHRDLEKIFPEDQPKAFHAGLNRLVRQNILERVARGVYLNKLSHRRQGPQTLELIARTLRRGHYNYVSLESALSEYGAISQIPMDRMTVMSTGRKGEYKTPYGTIEFTHTQRAVADILQNTRDLDRPLRMATKQAAYRDLRRVGRNTHLVETELLHED